jgi:hypothetical protein
MFMKEKLDSILVFNDYLICCKLSEPNSEKSKFAQKYLTHKISKALNKDTKVDIFKILSNIVSYFF